MGEGKEMGRRHGAKDGLTSRSDDQLGGCRRQRLERVHEFRVILGYERVSARQKHTPWPKILC